MCAFAALISIAAFQSGALAQQQTVHHFADSRIEIDSWTFVPIYSGQISPTTQVDGFFAYEDAAARTGNNLSAIWYSFDQGAWSASSWYTTNLQEALKSIVLTLNIDNTLWENIPGTPFTGTPEPPKPFSKGVIATDPMAPILNGASNPLPIAELLANAGYAAASVPVMGNQACNREEILIDIAGMASEYIEQGDQTITDMPIDELCNRTPRGNPPTHPPKPTTAPAWSTVPFLGPLPGPASSPWTIGPWPVVPAWACRTVPVGGGAHNCICSHSRRVGRWETRSILGYTWIAWHEVIETESCTEPSTMTPCPPAGGPPTSSMLGNCSSHY